MEISGESVGDVSVVTARGRLDGATSGPFSEKVQSFATAENPKVLIDFAGIDFVTSAGLRAVLQILKQVKANRGALALCNVQRPVREVLDITGFAAMIDIHPERGSALKALA